MARAVDVENNLIDVITQFRHDPLGFVQFAFPWGVPGTPLERMLGPTLWQAQALVDIGVAVSKTGKGRFATASGKGIGKSCTLAWEALWGLCTFPDTRLRITAGTETQLRTTTMPELSKWFRLLICRDWFTFTATSIYAKDPEREKTWRLDAIPWNENNPEAFAGLHNFGKRIVFIMDEASQIADPIYDTTDGIFTDKDTEVIWSCYGNPTRGTGRFREAFSDRNWITKHIDSRDVPVTDKAELQKLLEREGSDDTDYFRVMVRGLFPRVASMQFITNEAVEQARKIEVRTDPGDALVMGVDVARFGGSKSVIAFRKGRDARSIPWVALDGADTMVLASTIAQLYNQYNVDAVHVDGGGVGGGVVDRLRQMHVPVREVQLGGKPDRQQTDTDGARYSNKRTECWGVMREMLPLTAIPDEGGLAKELLSQLYGYRNDMEMQLVSKEVMLSQHGVKSPDYADALAMTFAFPVLKKGVGAGGLHAQGKDRFRAKIDYDPFATAA